LPRKNNRISLIELPVKTRRARAKGKKVFSVSITLTQEQIDWLQKQPNASEIIRKLLDDLIAAGNDVQPKLEVISLNHQIQELEKELHKTINERNEFHHANWSHWKKILNPDGSVHKDSYGNEFLDLDNDYNRYYSPNPIDNSEDTQVALRVLNGYNEAIRKIEQKIADVKAKILQLE
jgi:hypothetical protein